MRLTFTYTFFISHVYIFSIFKIFLLIISDYFILELIDKYVKVKRIEYTHNDGTEIAKSQTFDTD